MSRSWDDGPRGAAVVTGAAGQDGFLLTRRLLGEGQVVHAVVRRASSLDGVAIDETQASRLIVHEMDVSNPAPLGALVRSVRPAEVFNLAGQSSVSASFADPLMTWRTNVDPVVTVLEAIRDESPGTVLYQSSSSEMFGAGPDEVAIHNETSPLAPQSPYAAAKAAAHLACRVYREGYGVAAVCGILFNHESSRRPSTFLSRKLVDHVSALHAAGSAGGLPPLRMGNLKAQRDWGFAPDYVEGILLVARQTEVRARRAGATAETGDEDTYRDYVLGTGQLHAVWELVDRAFACGGFELSWSLEGTDPTRWRAHFRDGGKLAVEVDPIFIRPADPIAIQADASRARRELGWSPRLGLDVFLTEMLANAR